MVVHSLLSIRKVFTSFHIVNLGVDYLHEFDPNQENHHTVGLCTDQEARRQQMNQFPEGAWRSGLSLFDTSITMKKYLYKFCNQPFHSDH